MLTLVINIRLDKYKLKVDSEVIVLLYQFKFKFKKMPIISSLVIVFVIFNLSDSGFASSAFEPNINQELKFYDQKQLEQNLNSKILNLPNLTVNKITKKGILGQLRNINKALALRNEYLSESFILKAANTLLKSKNLQLIDEVYNMNRNVDSQFNKKVLWIKYRIQQWASGDLNSFQDSVLNYLKNEFKVAFKTIAFNQLPEGYFGNLNHYSIRRSIEKLVKTYPSEEQYYAQIGNLNWDRLEINFLGHWNNTEHVFALDIPGTSDALHFAMLVKLNLKFENLNYNNFLTPQIINIRQTLAPAKIQDGFFTTPIELKEILATSINQNVGLLDPVFKITPSKIVILKIKTPADDPPTDIDMSITDDRTTVRIFDDKQQEVFEKPIQLILVNETKVDQVYAGNFLLNKSQKIRIQLKRTYADQSYELKISTDSKEWLGKFTVNLL